MKKAILLSVVLLAAVRCQARTITVDDDGPCDFNNVQAAIDDSEDGDEIIVSPGTYTENINFNGKNITLTSADPNDPNVVANTILDGDYKGPVVFFANGEDANSVLAGFTITKGWDTHGGGVRIHNSSPRIWKNIILGNFVNANGAGISCENSDSELLYNVVAENVNMGGSGGGIYGRGDCNLTIEGNLIRGNSSKKGGGIYYAYVLGEGHITNNTIVYNLAEISGGGVVGGDKFFFTNNILRNNEPNDIEGISPDNIWYNTLTDPKYDGFQGNITADPLFADANNGDFHLKSEAGRYDPNTGNWTIDDVTSPAIDAGDPNSDYSREPEPNGGRINMGAYGGREEASKSYLSRTIYVDDDGPCDFNNIQAAIDDANDGDTISVAPGVYDINEPITYRGKNITLKSEAGAEETIIKGDYRSRIFIFNSGENNNAVLEGFTITGGRGSDGGGVYCEKSSPTIKRCIILYNRANLFGGGVAFYNSNARILDCDIIGNFIAGNYRNGGGIHTGPLKV